MDYLIMLSFAQLIYTFLLSIVFFSKERINKKENNIYSYLLIETVALLSFGIILYSRESSKSIFSLTSDHTMLPLSSPSQLLQLDTSVSVLTPLAEYSSLVKLSGVISSITLLFLFTHEFKRPACENKYFLQIYYLVKQR